MIAPLRDEALAEDALLLHFGDSIDEATSARVLAAAAAIALHVPSLECVPAYASLLLRFDPGAWRGNAADMPHARVRAAVAEVLATADVADAPARERVIPVLYGGAHGPDLAAVAQHAGLSEAEVIARHAGGRYRVAMLGFAPGFPYLLGLDPRLAVPRRADPRARVPAGSVAVGGAQTGIYPEALPGGWQLIGRTPLGLFDMRAIVPSWLQPGDRVRFEAIDAARFDALQERAA
ncbi:5-oxoprolinase subunit PxpB [Dyella sp.]|uniref:5-oxoprolinase subunit PxpB n=1 Tax=Dyella sp. TaxID=1869338 RepID=UPI002D77A354|nr:5-oxoprolinase subunit PxpB [Dyella sp.]HET6432594.1 5-oxoprolinase subunit PxpB [Dyella sp.]